MESRIRIIPGIKYHFQHRQRPNSEDAYIDFLGADLRDIILHIKFRASDRSLILNSFKDGVWNIEDITAIDGDDGLSLSILFDVGCVDVDVNGKLKRYHLSPSAVSQIHYRRNVGFEEVTSLLELRTSLGQSSIELSSLEYTILVTRLARLESIVHSFIEHSQRLESYTK